jgi:thiol:disulfide interchange protein
MKKLKNFLIATIMALSIWLLYRLFSQEEFTRVDYIFMMLLGFAGILSIALEAYRRKKEHKP